MSTGQKLLVNALFFLGTGVAAFFPEAALSAPWDSTATKVINTSAWLAQAISIFAVTVCLIAAHVGRLSWHQSLKISAGMLIVFFVASIIRMF
jgi:type IV secretory pathway VirB2 component (pilin)